MELESKCSEESSGSLQEWNRSYSSDIEKRVYALLPEELPLKFEHVSYSAQKRVSTSNTKFLLKKRAWILYEAYYPLLIPVRALPI